MDPFVIDGHDLSYHTNSRFSQTERAYLNYGQASDSITPLSNSVLAAITSASHEVLIRSGNAAYASINVLHLQAKYELQAQRNLVTQLQDVINKLTSSQNHQMSRMSTRAPSNGRPEVLVVPDAPEPLGEEEYPDVPYWYDEDWIKHSERQKICGDVVPRLGFLTDSDGSLVTESRIKIFTSTAKQAWNELYRYRLDPSSWTKKTPKAASYLAHVLKTSFPEFRYCDGDWKVERFAVIKYPDWCRDARESGRLTRARPSKRKIGEASNTNDYRRRKKMKDRSTVPPGTEVIDLRNDVPAGPVTSHSTSSLAIVSATPLLSTPIPLSSTPIPLSSTPIPLSSTPIPLLSSCVTQQEPPTPAIVPVPATQISCSPTHQTEAPSSAHMPTHTNLTVSSPNDSNLSSSTSPLAPSNQTLPNQAAANENTTLANSGVCGASVTETPLGEQEERVPPHRINPLADLSIPKPSIQVPMEASTTTSSKAKAGKPMVASPTVLTARNLFAIDYLKDHTATISEFKTVWDKVPSETKKKYEALSKERKVASRLATTTTQSNVAG
ncbi:hypothetical protein BC826DRAFT_1111260 [Russula brevipes]|nr:hypothetical protein BC826DRAFT_1111260 [Russula brevipes]